MVQNSSDKVNEEVPNTEVIAKAKRKRFTAAEKLRILREVEACRGSGEIGALLRREGIYSSYLTTWRKQRESGDSGVQAVLAQAGAGEPERARMGDPQGGERQHGGGGDGSDTVIQHAEPGIELAQFLPPFDLDGVAGERAHTEQEQHQEDQEGNAGRGRTAAGRNFIPGHLLRVAPGQAAKTPQSSHPVYATYGNVHRPFATEAGGRQ